jgi:ActR/RegA family two-component response regulator
LVDDDQTSALAIAEFLEARGYTTRIAATVDMAMKIARDYRPDGVVVEVRLGREDGLALIPDLRRHFPEIISIVLTGHADIESAICALRHRADDFLRKPVPPEEVARVLRQSFSRIKVRQRVRDVQARENFFGRLLVRRFAHLFIEDDGSLPVDKVVSRRILPGFFVAVDMMLGPELVEDYQRQCREIVNRMSGSNGGDVSWEDYYADQEAIKLVLDAEIKMALHFREIEKRVVWLTTLINNHVGAASHRPSAQLMTPQGTTILLSNLFSDLTKVLSENDGRRFIVRHYGEDVCARLAQVAEKFQGQYQH